MSVIYLMPKKMMPRKYRGYLEDHEPEVAFRRTLLHFVFAAIAFVILFRYFENTSWLEALWQFWQTGTTVGYGNAPATTMLGRIATMIFGTRLIVLLPVLIQDNWNRRVYHENRRRLGRMENEYENGYVIFNFPGEDRARKFIKEIRGVKEEEYVSVCFVDSDLRELPDRVATSSKTSFVKGNLLNKETYERANLLKNKTVIIFPEKSGSSGSDAGTAFIAQQLFKFVGNKVRIIYVLVSEENRHYFSDILATGVVEDSGIKSLVQECQDSFSASLIDDLLSNTKGANPKTVKPVKVVGWTWGRFMVEVIRIGVEKNISINPLGLIQNSVADACPSFDAVIKEGDFISVAVYDGFNWDEFEKNL